MRDQWDDDVRSLDDLSFNEWVTFVFDHPVVEPTWYLQDEWNWRGSRERFLEQSTRLFSAPEFLLNDFRVECLNQGFWYLASFDCLAEWLWDGSVAWAPRRDCVVSMLPLYHRLFAINPLHDICFMWWDMLRYFGDKPRNRMKALMVDVLASILEIPSPDCRYAALHGLGHLDLPKKRRVVGAFIANHPECNSELRDYASDSLAGQVL